MNLHIKNLDERMHINEDRVLDNANLTPDDIVKLRLEQEQVQNCLIWLTNIRKAKFPNKIVGLNGNKTSLQ